MVNMDKENNNKVRCSVCGDIVVFEGQHLVEHGHKYTGAKIICYGSFLPIFIDGKGHMQVGNVMYISRKKRIWDDDDE